MSSLFVVKWVNKMSKKRAGLFVVTTLVGLFAGCSFDPKVAAKKYVTNGNKYYDRGKYKEASIMYRRALSKDMRNADAWYRLGLTNMKLSILPEARRDFLRAMELDPNNTDAVVKLGEIDLVYYMADSRGNKALLGDIKELTQTLLKKDPKSFDGLRFSGYIAMLDKDLKTAIQKFGAANQVKPNQPEMMFSLVQILFADNQPEEALKYANALIESKKRLRPDVRRCLLLRRQDQSPRAGRTTAEEEDPE